MGKREIRSSAAPAPLGTYSQALVAGDFLYTSGMGPIHPETGEVVGTDVAEQTRQVLANLSAILAEHGLGLDDVVKSTVHLQDLHRDFPAYDKVYREHFNEPYPVRTTVGSDLMNILVEIDFVAYKQS
ncbi:RidA family protein [Actinomadura sp. 3N508]|uniref:RidA family protein n=1 Tax=Actinomadura sp. 3N508 TaxID=3375153 RepID=UPI003797D71B